MDAIKETGWYAFIGPDGPITLSMKKGQTTEWEVELVSGPHDTAQAAYFAAFGAHFGTGDANVKVNGNKQQEGCDEDEFEDVVGVRVKFTPPKFDHLRTDDEGIEETRRLNRTRPVRNHLFRECAGIHTHRCGGATVCTIGVVDKETGTRIGMVRGYAYCSVDDVYDHKFGEQLSEARTRRMLAQLLPHTLAQNALSEKDGVYLAGVEDGFNEALDGVLARGILSKDALEILRLEGGR